MAQATISIVNRPTWIELSSAYAAASRDFYGRLFGWKLDISPDPQYGGYAMAKIGEKIVAGIGQSQTPLTPTAWGIYIATDDIERLMESVKRAGGSVVAAPFEVGDQGRMAVFQDPTGAVVSAWQPSQMRGFDTDVPNAFGWAELNARGVDQAIAFYRAVFGWSPKTSEPAPGQPPYTEFQVDGESIAGAMEMNPEMPDEVPSYWMVYFNVIDVDGAFQKALELGATEMVAPSDFPNGRFAILGDPQGASFGLLKLSER